MSLVFARIIFFASVSLNYDSIPNDSIDWLSSNMALYHSIAWPADKPVFEAFDAAVAGYHALQDSLGVFDRDVVTIIDFSQPSTVRRLWVIDLRSKEVLLNTLVAHGRNSGIAMATHFSNKHESLQSSLGFYRTGQTYLGRHGISLLLHGLEPGINDHARSRAIVVHGADYVSDRYIQVAGRLGRSQGCPAVPMEDHRKLIETIKGQTCLFIYAPVEEYASRSKLHIQFSNSHRVVNATASQRF
ncbi:MAG TPA: murein L,D-transpeptidase catalytic domain family protein [Chryseosolibacter sp.]